MADKSSKTEEATPKRLRDTKKKGNVAKSGDLNSAISFFVFTMLLTTLGQFVIGRGLSLMKNSLGRDYTIELSNYNINGSIAHGSIDILNFLYPFFIIAILVGVISNLAQAGFIFSVEPLKVNFKRINPVEGFKGIFSKKSLVNLVKNVLKLSLVFYLAYRNLSGSLKQVVNSGRIGTEKLFFFTTQYFKDMSTNIAIIMIILAIVDYIFQRRNHKKDLMMTKQEIKDEFKEMEGDPQIKSARRQRQRQLSQSRMMSDVETSTVVVTNPTHIAVALRYDSDRDKAPIVTAKGADYIANKIKERAKEHEVPILENKELARVMYKKTEIGDYVPVELYKAVAEILVMVYQIQEKNKKKI